MEKAHDKDNENKEAKPKKKKPFSPPKPPPEDEKKEARKKRGTEQKPFMVIDRGGNAITNFFSNLLRQFKNPNHTGLRDLFSKKKPEPEQQPEPQKPEPILGAAKTEFRNGKAIPQYGGVPEKENKQAMQKTQQSSPQTQKAQQESQQQQKPSEATKKRRMGF